MRGKKPEDQGWCEMEAHEPPASYAEYCRLPEDAPRYEILGGVGYLTPPPGGRHQRVSANLLYLFCHQLRLNPIGQVFDAPFDVILSEGDVVQPDLLFVANERLGIVRERGVFGTPDLVVEILSPANATRDLQQKQLLYRRFSIREYWVVDVDKSAVDIWLSLESALDTRRVATPGGVAESSVLPGMAIPVAEIFAGVDLIPLG